jgi:hypothetical protein
LLNVKRCRGYESNIGRVDAAPFDRLRPKLVAHPVSFAAVLPQIEDGHSLIVARAGEHLGVA